MRRLPLGKLSLPYPLTPLVFSVFLSFNAHSAPTTIARTETELSGPLLQVASPQENVIVKLANALTVTSTSDQGAPIEVLYNGLYFPEMSPTRFVSFRNAQASTQDSAPRLTLNDTRTIARNRSFVIHSFLGNNTLTFFGDVSMVAQHTLTGDNPMVQLFAVRAVGDRINFKQNVTLRDSSFITSDAQTGTDTTSLISLFQATKNGSPSFSNTGIVFGVDGGSFETHIENVRGELQAANARMTVLNTDTQILNNNNTTVRNITFTNTGEQAILSGLFTLEGSITNYAPVTLSQLKLMNPSTETSYNYLTGVYTGISSTEYGVVGVITNKSTVSIESLTIDSGSSDYSGSDAGVFGMRSVGGQILNEANVSIRQLTQVGSSTQTTAGVQADDPEGLVRFDQYLNIEGIHTSDTAHEAIAAGVRAINSGTITVAGKTSITDIAAPTGTAYGVEVHPGVVRFDGQVIIKSLSGQSRYSLVAINDSDDNEEPAQITLAAAAHEIEGDIIARRANNLPDTNPESNTDYSLTYSQGKADVSAHFAGETAYLKGWTHLGASTTKAKADTSTLDLTFSDGARWEMVSSNPSTLGETPTARLSSLTLDKGHVYVGTTQEDFNNSSTLFADSASVLGSTTAPATLDVNTLSGTGDFYLRARLADNTDASDRVRVRETATGSFTLHVKSSGNNSAPVEQAGYLVEVTDPNTTATFTLFKQKPVEVGLYQYALATRGSTTRQWYLRRLTSETPSNRPSSPSTPLVPDTSVPTDTPITTDTASSETPVTPSVPSEPETPVASGKPVYSTSALALFSLGDLSAHALLNQESLNHVRYRHGSIRSRAQEGLWVDLAHHHLKSNTVEDTRTKLRFNTMTLGYDTQVGQSPWLVGAIFSTAKGDRSARHVQPTIRGDFNHWSGSLYATYLRDNGAYINLMGTVSRLSQDVDTQMIDGEPVSGKIKSRGSGVSVELGHKFDLSRLFFVEPSLQLSYGHYRAHNTVLSNGMTLTQTSFNSLTGRAGFTAGAKVWREGDLLGEVWLNAGVMREFKGESTLHVNGVAFEDTLLGTRYYYGMGADLAFTPNVKLYAVAEHQQGKLMQDSLGLKAGIKWQF